MKNLLITFCLCFFSFWGIGQSWSCGFNETNITSSSPEDHPCISNDPDVINENPLYMPDDTDAQSLEIKTIRLKFNVFHFSDNNPLNFSTQEEEDFLRSLVEIINGNLLSPINCPIFNTNGGCVCDETYCTSIGGSNDCCLSDSKLRFHLEEEINYIVDPLAWDCSGGGGTINNCTNDYCNYIPDTYLNNEDCILNVYFFEPPGQTSTGGCGPGRDNEVENLVLIKNIHSLKSDDLNAAKQPMATLLLHEVLHGLGLHHTNEPAQSFPDVFPNEVTGSCNPNVDSFCTNNIMSQGWRPFQNWLSPHQIGNTHRLLIGSWKSKMLKVDFDALKSITVNQDETWDVGKIIYGDVFVTGNAKLTINCKVIMPPGGKIHVLPGSELIVDGGLITISSSHCVDYWDGIYAHGLNSASQLPNTQGNLEQARVEVINEGTIAYANVGIRTFDSEGIIQGQGGIVYCNDARFLNNVKSIELGPYQNFDPFTGDFIPNVSEIVNSEFTFNDDYTGVGLVEHVFLREVDGIQFIGCDFLNETTPTPSSFVRGIGIMSVDANFSALGMCEPNNDPCPNPDDWDRTTFVGLQDGIRASATGINMRTYEVDRCDFINNFKGITSSAVMMPLITRNDFEIGIDYFSWFPPVGVDIIGGTGYTVQANDFIGTSQNINVGTLVRETGDADNEVRGNTYENLHVANLSNGDNFNEFDDNMGLNYLCNINNNNTFDFSVPNEPFNQGVYGIRTWQGADDEAAGNSFTPNPLTSESHFHNQSGLSIFYWHFTGENPTAISASVINNLTLDENECVVEFPEIMGPGNEDKSRWESLFVMNFDNRVITIEEYNQLIDEGQTSELLEEISTANGQNIDQLLNHLEDISPWLSTHVLKAAGSRSDIIDHAAMLNLLLLNPDESRKNTTLEHFANKPNPLPENMIATIGETTFSTTDRTLHESQLAYYNGQINSYAAKLTHYFMTDKNDKNVDSTLYWLSMQESLESKMAIVDHWIGRKNAEQSANELNNLMGQQYNLSPKQQLELNYFRNLKQIQINLIENGLSQNALIERDLEDVITIAINCKGLAGHQARNILNNYYEYELYENPILPEIGENRLIKGEMEQINNEIYAFPNPASTLVNFHFKVDENYKNMSIRILDSRGHLIEEIPIDSQVNGYHTWNASGVTSGFYFFSICSNQHTLASGKLVISR